jgi:hypothetical protein
VCARHHSGAPGQLLADAVSVRRGHFTLGQVDYTQHPDGKGQLAWGVVIGPLTLPYKLLTQTEKHPFRSVPYFSARSRLHAASAQSRP